MIKKYSLRGKKGRAAGTRFEAKVRAELEKAGWIVDKWSNNVDLEKNKLVKAKRKFNPYLKVLVMSTGFPDFIAFKNKKNFYEIIGVEVKSNGWLDKEEKEKINFLLKNKIFNKVIIAKKGKKRGSIEYLDFEKGKLITLS
ncbi:MAG: hypothetical protein KatS3mg001_444 [Candidatus Pacearchaeota archaeon]|nr:MAG: hypothetical protein KatS3mg001_444 [Candidatus Pacearchaeota archaeon]